jgi:hypothetical protein
MFNKKNPKDPLQMHFFKPRRFVPVSGVVFLRQSDGCLSHYRFKFDSRPVHEEVLNKVTLERF